MLCYWLETSWGTPRAQEQATLSLQWVLPCGSERSM